MHPEYDGKGATETGDQQHWSKYTSLLGGMKQHIQQAALKTKIPSESREAVW